VDIQRWFAIESPKEMSEAFAEVSAIYYIAQLGAIGEACSREIERRLECIRDQSEWFAAGLCLDAVLRQQEDRLRRAS
jgi:hypothetical protein